MAATTFILWTVDQINFIVIIGILKFCMKFKWEVRWWHGIEFMISCFNVMLNYQFSLKLKLLGDSNFILILLFWILEELQHIQKLLLSSDKFSDPTAVFVMGVEFVWWDTSLNVCTLQKMLLYVCVFSESIFIFSFY